MDDFSEDQLLTRQGDSCNEEDKAEGQLTCFREERKNLERKHQSLLLEGQGPIEELINRENNMNTGDSPDEDTLAQFLSETTIKARQPTKNDPLNKSDLLLRSSHITT